MKVEEIIPYSPDGDKGEQVELMFDSIATHYDFMNTAMSFGQHKRWRNKALKSAIKRLPGEKNNLNILDVATGTGDVAFRLHEMLPDAYITGLDLSEGMLNVARKKLDTLPERTKELIAFGKGDSLSMPFHDNEFQLVTVAYGIRNFKNLRKGLQEMRRVLGPGGVLCIIELSNPEGYITGNLYRIYSEKIIPWMGKKITGDSAAYNYLPESISACPQKKEMGKLLSSVGFSNIEWKTLSFGALTYYIAQ